MQTVLDIYLIVIRYFAVMSLKKIYFFKTQLQMDLSMKKQLQSTNMQVENVFTT